MGTIILTSIGLSDKKIANRFFSLVKNKETSKVAIITTAARNKENNKFSQLAKQQFINAGFKNIDYVDLEYEKFSSDNYNIVYVCGGNTFNLLKFAKERKFDFEIKKILEKNGIYIGVSAGSIIMTPSIDIANEIEPDDNPWKVKEFSAFNFVNFHVMPHYTKKIEKEISKFETKHHVQVERLSDNEALFVSNNTVIKVK